MIDNESLCLPVRRAADDFARSLTAAMARQFPEASVEAVADSTEALDPGRLPKDAPRQGFIVLHRPAGTEDAPTTLPVAWFFPTAFPERAGLSPPETLERLRKVASELAANPPLQNHFGELDSTAVASEDLWGEYLGNDLPGPIVWQRLLLKGMEAEQAAYLAWPSEWAARVFAPDAITEEGLEPNPSLSNDDPQADAGPKPLSARLQRLLRTRVPVIVTLAQKTEPAAKIMDLGPGSIIEFDRGCDEPLQLSINNLPIGLGEAVKVGDHFGLKVLSIVPVGERVARLGAKWAY